MTGYRQAKWEIVCLAMSPTLHRELVDELERLQAHVRKMQAPIDEVAPETERSLRT